ncbi:MAG: hypothetical protein IPO29_10945 [Anaerolineae bacterium]|nr:hypothetical protein [Anaerolineae bacterium]
MSAPVVSQDSGALNSPSAPGVYGISVFELDGNAVPFNFTAPPTVTLSATDWFSVYNKTLSPSLALANITSVGFRLDGTGSNEDIFQPSSKINQELSAWAFTSGGAPDKGDLVNSMGAIAVHPGTLTETLAYLGLSRTDNSGSTSYGFWLLQPSVVMSGGQLFISGTNTLATHKVNDLLVLSDFSNGGSVDRIQLYRWNGTGTTSLFDLNGVNIADCRNAPADPIGCGRSNTVPISVTWPYYNKGEPGFTSTVPIGQFFETGVNLTRILGGNQGCYSSLVAFSSASFSDSSSLKDSVLASLQTCAQIEMVKSATPQSKEGDVITYTITMSNPGATLMRLQTFSDRLVGNLTNLVTSTTACGVLNPSETCSFNYGYTVPAGAFANTNPITNVAFAVYVPPSGQQFSRRRWRRT